MHNSGADLHFLRIVAHVQRHHCPGARACIHHTKWLVQHVNYPPTVVNC